MKLAFIHWRLVIGLIALAGMLGGVLVACAPPPGSQLDRVLSSGKLRVLTRHAATTYYEGPHGPTGLEYDLLQRFAERLGVEVELRTPDTLQDILGDLVTGDADLAAAGLTVTTEREKQLRFTPPYQQITQQLVYRRSTTRPGNLSEAADGQLEVVANSSHTELLRRLQVGQPELNWDETPGLDSMELLTLVAENIIDYTIIDSNELALNRRYYPGLNVAFDVSEPQSLAWAFARDEDNSLYAEASLFFNDLKASGELARLVEGYYSHVERYDYAGTRTFLKHVKQRLPRYRALFEQTAAQNGLDWRLVAAVAYQESHWNPHAVSPTGVRGIMMLTRATAAHLGIDKRTDPEQSIEGGTRYLRRLIERVPASIDQPERTWLALAAYNVGFGHLEDARDIVRLRGGNPNEWGAVKDSLPLLRKRKWYKKTRYGYARGNEPVRYVENIRSYYEILDWYLDNEEDNEPMPKPILAIASPAL